MGNRSKGSNVPSSRKVNPSALMGAASLTQRYSAPIPPASEMAKYEEISPGAANRLIVLMEQQAQHRQNMETKVIQSAVRDQHWGVVFAFIIAMSALGVAALCVWLQHEIVGAVIGGSGIGSIITAFIYGTRSNRAERESK